VSALGAAILALPLLAACSSSSPDDSADGGDGVEYGATKAEYQEAFADIDPIELQVQTGGTEGAPANQPREAYMEAVTEWSDGKITFDIAYGNGIVASPIEVDDALSDGRLDLSFSLLLSSEPDFYPVNSVFADLSFLGKTGVIGPLAASSWMLEALYEQEAFQQEAEDAGFILLVPDPPALVNTAQLTCRDGAVSSLDDAAGLLVSVNGAAKQAQAEALGMTPVSMPWNEEYEALQRGIIDCSMQSMSALQAGGLVDVAQFETFDSEVSIASTVTNFGFSLEVWDSLPLVARQLLFDRLDVYLSTSYTLGLTAWKAGTDVMLAGGGDLVDFDDEARDAINGVSDDLLVDVADRGLDIDVDELVDSAGRWQGVVADALDFSGMSAKEFVEEYSTEQIEQLDTSAIWERLYEDVLLDHRPS